MENGEQNTDRWVEDRMAQLEPAGEWRPNPDGAWARLRTKDRVAHVHRRRWGWSLAAVLAVAASLFTIPGCQAATCKMQSDTLAERIWKSVFAGDAQNAPKKVQPQEQVLQPQSGAPAPQPTMAAAAVRRPVVTLAPAASIPPKNFKLSGSGLARVTCEVYTDYECPACARFYLTVAPQLVADYVATGKVKLLHRDPDLSVSLAEGENRAEIESEWREWVGFLRLPALVGRTEAADVEVNIDVVDISRRRPSPRRRGRSVTSRRPRFLTRRKVGAAAPGATVGSDPHVLFRGSKFDR